VADVTEGLGLGFQLTHIHRALGPNSKEQFIVSFLKCKLDENPHLQRHWLALYRLWCGSYDLKITIYIINPLGIHPQGIT